MAATRMAKRRRKGWWRFVSLTVVTHTIEREKQMLKGRIPRGFVWDRLLAAGRGSEESVWCLLTGRWEVAIGSGGGMVSAIGGGLAEEEDVLVILGSRGGMGGDFAKAKDGEGCLGTMVFNIQIMASSLEAMEVWAAAVEVWATASLAMVASRRSTQAAESSVSAIEDQQVRPNVRLLALVFEIKGISIKQRKQESEKERIVNIFLPVLFNTKGIIYSQ